MLCVQDYIKGGTQSFFIKNFSLNIISNWNDISSSAKNVIYLSISSRVCLVICIVYSSCFSVFRSALFLESLHVQQAVICVVVNKKTNDTLFHHLY